MNARFFPDFKTPLRLAVDIGDPAMALLSHPKIITVHDYGKAGPHCYLSMEFVDGVDLRGAMASKSTLDERLESWVGWVASNIPPEILP